MFKRLPLALFLLFLLVSGVGVMAQDQITVTLWMHNHPPRIPLDRELIAKFEEANPNIKVDAVIDVPVAEWDTKLATALASGAGPDLFNQWTGAIGQFFAQGVLAPVDPAALGVADQAAVYAMYGEEELGRDLLSGATFNDTLYGIPTELSIYGCFANNAIWEAAGLDPETDFPATWEDLVGVAEQLTTRDENGVPVVRGFDYNWGAPLFMYLQFNAMVEQLGGNMIDEVNYTASIDTPEVRRVLQYWNDLVNVYNLGGPQYTISRDAFQAGEMGIECTQGNWAVPILDGNGIDWSLHKVPRWSDAVNDSAYSTYAYFFMVNSGSAPEVQAAAWKLAAFLTSEPGRYLNEAGLFQPVASYLASDEYKNSDQGKLMPFFFEEMSKTPYHPRIAGFDEAADALARMRDRVISGGESMDTVLPEAEAEVNDILARALAAAQAATGS